MLTGSVLITGGAGFLGRGIIRRAAQEGWPTTFIVYSRDQQKHEYLKAKYPGADVRCFLGDVLDTDRLSTAMQFADVVIHAAALKHLPECEAQPSAAIHINVDGTRSVLAAAMTAEHVKRVVCISTDKAAAPMNTYGMTKALVERLVFETAVAPLRDGTEVVACRYGNVIGSTGSVWPVFKQQRERNGRLRVMNPAMTRFFTPIDMAVDVIDYAVNHAKAASVVIPAPYALNIGRLADHLTDLWNLEPYEIVGERPGEKSHEAMLAFNELSRVQRHGPFYRLVGPTRVLDDPSEFPGATSDTAAMLSPEDFVRMATASEEV